MITPPSAPPPPVTEEDPSDYVPEDLRPAGGGEPSGEPSVDPTQPADPSQSAAPATPALTLTPEALAQALQLAGLGATQQQQPQQRQPLTPEQKAELRRQLKFFEPKPDFFQRFNNMETQAAAFNEFLEAYNEQMYNMMESFFGEREQGIAQRYDPVVQQLKKMQEDAQLSRFDAAYSQLADPNLRPILKVVAQSLKSQIDAGQRTAFNSEGELFKALATGMEAIFKTQDPNFKLTAGSTPATPGIRPAPQRGGGAAGGGNKSAAASGVPKAVSFMPPVRS